MAGAKQLLLLSTKDAWRKFKLHTVRLEDKVLRSRLDTPITSIPDCETASGRKSVVDEFCVATYKATREDEYYSMAFVQREKN